MKSIKIKLYLFLIILIQSCNQDVEKENINLDKDLNNLESEISKNFIYKALDLSSNSKYIINIKDFDVLGSVKMIKTISVGDPKQLNSILEGINTEIEIFDKKEINSFNEDGYLISLEVFNSNSLHPSFKIENQLNEENIPLVQTIKNGNDTLKHFFVYNKRKQIISITNKENNLVEEFLYGFYDELPVEIISYNNGKEQDRIRILWKENLIQHKETIFNNEFTDQSTTPDIIELFEYHDNGNYSATLEKIGFWGKYFKEETVYNKKGDEVLISKYNSQNDIILSTSFLYNDENLNEIRRIGYKEFDKLSIFEDESDRWHKNISDSIELLGLQTFSYDKKGNVLKINYPSGENDFNKSKYIPTIDNTDATFRYKYDSKGNWIEKIRFNENQIRYYWKRSIHYY